MSRLALALLGEELAVPVAPSSSCGLLRGECPGIIEDEGEFSAPNDGDESDYSDTRTSTKKRGRRRWCPSSQGCPAEQTRAHGPFLIDDTHILLGWVASRGYTAIKQAVQRPIADYRADAQRQKRALGSKIQQGAKMVCLLLRIMPLSFSYHFKFHVCIDHIGIADALLLTFCP
jgi:hypothetical protein